MQRFLVCHWRSTLASLFSCTIRIAAALGVVSAGVPEQTSSSLHLRVCDDDPLPSRARSPHGLMTLAYLGPGFSAASMAKRAGKSKVHHIMCSTASLSEASSRGTPEKEGRFGIHCR
ncbi:hypothetical protein V8C44DRAFT_344296 [Trichoderma aethiopicum]